MNKRQLFFANTFLIFISSLFWARSAKTESVVVSKDRLFVAKQHRAL